jgi:hypothetical protein
MYSGILQHTIKGHYPDSGGDMTIWERITRFKAPVIEPRDSGSFQACIDDYKAKLDTGGAVLFAVCRGKVRPAWTREVNKEMHQEI